MFEPDCVLKEQVFRADQNLLQKRIFCSPLILQVSALDITVLFCLSFPNFYIEKALNVHIYFSIQVLVKAGLSDSICLKGYYLQILF